MHKRSARLLQRLRGFTLIEVMVAIAIFALIAAITFPALIQFLDIRERLNKKHQSIKELQKTFLFFSRDMRYAVNRLAKDEFGEPESATMLIGDNSLVELTASYPDFNLDGVGVPRRVKWEIEEGVLYRIQYPVMDPDGDTRLLKQALLKDVRDAELIVHSVEDGRDTESKRWDEETRLPNMIRLNIEFESGIEYERVFSMLGGDKLEAVAATASAGPGGQPSDGDNPNAGADQSDDNPPARP